MSGSVRKIHCFEKIWYAESHWLFSFAFIRMHMCLITPKEREAILL